MLLFIAKKVVSRLLFPLPLSIALILIGLVCLWFTRRQKLGKVLATLGLCVLALCSSEVVGSALLRPLEERYPAFGPAQQAAVRVQDVRYIVVFAGCVPSFAEYPITRQVGDAPLARLVEGVRLYRLYPRSKLVLSGGLNCRPDAPEANLTNYRFAAEMGVPADDILIERASKDTDDQARLLAPILGAEPFILVTSASHMPRTMELFRAAGMQPIPAPTDHHTGLYGIFSKEAFGPESLYPNSGSLEKSEIALYEYLGLLWTQLTGGQ